MSTYEWTKRDPTHPYDDALRGSWTLSPSGVMLYTTSECLRILEANGFKDPVFQWKGSFYVHDARCIVTGPDGLRYDGRKVLGLIFKAERLERLCRDRHDVVMGMLHREAQQDGKS